jgi:hypothetical protein
VVRTPEIHVPQVKDIRSLAGAIDIDERIAAQREEQTGARA